MAGISVDIVLIYCRKMLNILKEFCKRSSVHGLELVVNDKKSVKEKVFWGCLIGIATILLSQNVYLLGMKATHSNVELIVDNPNYNLENADFPAVTVCSNSKVMRTKLTNYIKYVQTNSKQPFLKEDVEKLLNSVLALDLMKHPHLQNPALFVEQINNTVLLIPNHEIFDLMMSVRPKVSDMITACKWRGRMVNCKFLFRKQVTEEGFCYSFNSRTAVRSKDDLPRLPPEEKLDGTLECLRNNAAGRASGLSFALKSLDLEMFKESLQTRGYSIMVHSPDSYPQSSEKYLVFWKNSTFSRISVQVTTIRTDETFSRITESARGCCMEKTDPYTCILRCRQREIVKQCGCSPYYMYHFNRYAKTCGIQDFKCLQENSKRFRNAHVIGNNFKIPEWSQPLSMSCQCELPCSSTSYETDYTVIPIEEVSGKVTEQNGCWIVCGLVPGLQHNHNDRTDSPLVQGS